MALVVVVSRLILLVLAIVLATSVSVCIADQSTYYIYPEDTCSVGEDCLILSDIVNERDKYLTNNVTLFFSPGHHTLYDELVSVVIINNLTLHGSSSSSGDVNTTFMCVNSSTLSFAGVSNLHIDSIKFDSCKIELSFKNAEFHNCSFENSSYLNRVGGAVAVYNSSDVQFQDCSFVDNEAWCGGAVAVMNSKVHFSGVTTLVDNKAIECGGAVFANSSNVTSSGTTTFEESMSLSGGAVCAYEYNVMWFSGNTTFTNNTANSDAEENAGGGALFAFENNMIYFSGNISFNKNVAYRGGAFYAQHRNTIEFSENVYFNENTAKRYGGSVYAEASNTINFSGNISFYGSRAESVSEIAAGGALFAFSSNMLQFSGNISFNQNKVCSHSEIVAGGSLFAMYNNTIHLNGNISFNENAADTDLQIAAGGVLFALEDNTIEFSGNISFNENRAGGFGGALYITNHNHVKFSGTNLFSSNSALLGGAMYAMHCNVEFTGCFSIQYNNASHGAGIFVEGGRVQFRVMGSFTKNSAINTAYNYNGYGGAILAISSELTFNGKFTISDNTAGFGGAITLLGTNYKSIMLYPGTNILFSRNSAMQQGGALYVLDNPFTYCDRSGKVSVEFDICFITLLVNNTYSCTLRKKYDGPLIGYNLTFVKNTAIESGNALYGGQLEQCHVCTDNGSVQGLHVFRELTKSSETAELEVSSDPYKVCSCMNNEPDCNQNHTSVQVFPGRLMSISAVSVGQLDGVTPSVVRAIPYNVTVTRGFKTTQPVGMKKQCTELQYPLLSNDSTATLQLYSDEPCSTSGLPLTVDITFLPCPIGFTLTDNGNCDCEERLLKYTQTCTIDILAIRREQGKTFWVGLNNQSGSEGLILHPHCPFDYCTDKALNLTLNDTDMQCSHGRSGVLCGACKSGSSLTLGSSQCMSGCSNKYLALILAFALAGIALVAFLFLCRLTVAKGTISGLIFYANVLAMNQTIFFPSDSRNILTVFIAWLNLDLGIETCFFVGLDTYWVTWLQFVFPIYIWVLVGAIIILAKYITPFAKLISKANPTAVLATLFLLSYTKLLQAIMVAFSFTTLEYPNDERKVVWLYDGSIGYLRGKHIALFLFSLLVFLFVFLPYTLLLLCGQWIMKKLQLIRLSPRKQLYLKSFLDAYHAPFNHKHRYWTGLLLVLRFFILFTSTIINIGSPKDPIVNLAILLGILSGMLAWSWLFIQRLYMKWYLDVLEASFIFNIIVLIGGTFTIRISGGNQSALIYTSVSVAFVTFIGIVIGTLAQKVKEIVHRKLQTTEAHQELLNENEPPHCNYNPLPRGVVTFSEVSVPNPHDELHRFCNTN